MVENPALEEFRGQVEALRRHRIIRRLLSRDTVRLRNITVDDVSTLCREEAGYYFLISAAGLNRTSLKKAIREPAVQIVEAKRRRAHAIKGNLPYEVSFAATAAKAIGLRAGDLGRKGRGEIERLFRERLAAERIPILMSPPVRGVPGLLVPERKPDGVFPDPKAGFPPRLYLEIKNVQRVADDIQKRLYEIAEASIEMKILYGRLQLTGLQLNSTANIAGNIDLQDRVRRQIMAASPAVVALFLCPRAEAERYRRGAETFVDRVFFQEEIEECLTYLKSVVQPIE
jgi:hypothetical protein